MLNEKLPPIEGELTDEDLKLVCGGDPPVPVNGGGFINGGGHHIDPPGLDNNPHEPGH
jgi:hypothetical protein